MQFRKLRCAFTWKDSDRGITRVLQSGVPFAVACHATIPQRRVHKPGPLRYSNLLEFYDVDGYPSTSYRYAMIISDEALRRYRENQFTDEDITRSTGLSVRAWRELIKIRAVRTETEKLGRGYVRWCDQMVLKRSAVIGTLSRAGLSLAASGHTAFSLPFHTLLYEICDPCAILLDRSADVNPRTGLPPRIKKPMLDWFSPDKAAVPDSKHDWLLKIYEGRFVGVIYQPQDAPMIFGDLRDGGRRFVAWWPCSKHTPRLGRLVEEFAPGPRIQAAAAAWENPSKFSKELNEIGYAYERHDEDDDPLRMAAQACIRNLAFSATINVTLAIRKALRRVLGVDPADAPERWNRDA